MDELGEVTPEQVFRIMCNYDACIMNYMTKLIPSTAIAEMLKISRYKAKKALCKLKNQGLIASGCENCYSSWHEQYFIVRGYYVTKAGKETDIYKQALKEEMELIDKIFVSGEVEKDG